MQRWHNIIPGFIKISLSGTYQLTHSPLLNEEDLLAIHSSATSNRTPPLISKHEVSTILVGERNSSYAGSGYEFAENQLYVAGDDPRYINWRLLARTGKIYRKNFIEERRPELWLVIDKRASMRFGTRKRLKVTQAAIQALYHLYQGHNQQLASGGVILNDTVNWYKPAQDLHKLQPLIDGIIEPAPPIHDKPGIDNLDLVLRQLVTRAVAGSIIILISDFHNLTSGVLGSIYLLSNKHRVMGKHIIDPVELALPETGKYQVATQKNQTSWLLDCDSASFRQKYQEKSQQWQKQIENKLTNAGVNYQVCMSDENSLMEGHYE